MSIHVIKCNHNGTDEYHLRSPGMTESTAQELADKINSGKLDDVVVSWDEYRTKILCVTRQNEEGQILSVIAETPIDSPMPDDLSAYYEQGWQDCYSTINNVAIDNWTVINSGGAEVASNASLESVIDALTPDRLARGWCAVCLIDANNPPKTKDISKTKLEEDNTKLLSALNLIQQKMADLIFLANNVGINDADGFYLGHAMEAEQKARDVIAEVISNRV